MNDAIHSHVPGLLPPKELAAKVALIKALAGDLDYEKVNFGQTVESILAHAKDQLRHERKLRDQVQSGRGR